MWGSRYSPFPFIQVTNLARCLQQLREANIQLVGLVGEAEKSLYQSQLNGAIALVLGAEEKGLRRLTRESCDELVIYSNVWCS